MLALDGIVKPQRWAVQRGLVKPRYRGLWRDLAVGFPLWGGGDPIDVVHRQPAVSFGGPTWVDSRIGTVLRLDGVDDYLEVDNTVEDTLGFTLAVLFRVAAFDISGQTLVAQGEGNNWRLPRNGTNNFMEFNPHRDASGVSTAAVDDGEWHLVVGTTGPIRKIRVYTDGNEDGGSTSYSTTTPGPIGPFLIGDNPGATGRYFEGDIGMLAIWGRELLTPEIDLLLEDPFGWVRRDDQVRIAVEEVGGGGGGSTFTPRGTNRGVGRGIMRGTL